MYDDAGQVVQTTTFANIVASDVSRQRRTFAQITTNVGAAPDATDDHTWFVYDGRGLLRGEVDADGDVTQYHYDPLGQVDQTITGQQLTVAVAAHDAADAGDAHRGSPPAAAPTSTT